MRALFLSLIHILQLTKKYFDSVVPAAGELNDYDRETLKEFADVKAEVEKLSFVSGALAVST